MKEMFIERQEYLLRIAIKNNNKLEECFMEQDTVNPCSGEIYSGIVKDIIPAIRSAFIDIGYEKNAYMYLDDKFNNSDLKKGEKLIVQVVREGTYNKGPKVINGINLSGIYSAVITSNNKINFSQKITDEEKKKFISSNIKKPDGIGVIVRTAAKDVKIDIINDELEKLYKVYNDIVNKYKSTNKAGLIFDNGGVIGKILKDRINYDNYKVYVNSERDYVFIRNFLENILDNKIDLELFNGTSNLFEYYGIEKELLSLLNNRIYLKCGGYIVIDKTEAMYVIDVNSGKNVTNCTMEKTAYITNYEAAEEAARQVRLRNLSGIIIIDFIDMKNEDNKCKVISKLQQGFLDDKNKTVIYPFTQLNLIQIARKRLNKSIYEYMQENCNICRGKGKMLKFEYLCMLIKNKIVKVRYNGNIKDIHIVVNQIYKKNVEDDIFKFISDIDALNLNIYLTYDLKDYFKVEPLIFLSQINALKKFNIYNSSSVKLK